MEPTLSSNDVIVTEHLSPMFKKFNYGDIVVSKSLNNPKEFVCKRIIGLPGDRIYFNKIQIVSNINILRLYLHLLSVKSLYHKFYKNYT